MRGYGKFRLQRLERGEANVYFIKFPNDIVQVRSEYMRRFWNILIFIYILFVHYSAHDYSVPFHTRLLWYSTLPVAGILMNINVSHIKFKEIKKCVARTVAYALSILAFLICELSVLGIVPLIPAELKGSSEVQLKICEVFVYMIFCLTLINLFFVARDGYRKDNGLPL